MKNNLILHYTKHFSLIGNGLIIASMLGTLYIQPLLKTILSPWRRPRRNTGSYSTTRNRPQNTALWLMAARFRHRPTRGTRGGWSTTQSPRNTSRSTSPARRSWGVIWLRGCLTQHLVLPGKPHRADRPLHTPVRLWCFRPVRDLPQPRGRRVSVRDVLFRGHVVVLELALSESVFLSFFLRAPPNLQASYGLELIQTDQT